MNDYMNDFEVVTMTVTIKGKVSYVAKASYNKKGIISDPSKVLNKSGS